MTSTTAWCRCLSTMPPCSSPSFVPPPMFLDIGRREPSTVRQSNCERSRRCLRARAASQSRTAAFVIPSEGTARTWPARKLRAIAAYCDRATAVQRGRRPSPSHFPFLDNLCSFFAAQAAPRAGSLRTLASPFAHPAWLSVKGLLQVCLMNCCSSTRCRPGCPNIGEPLPRTPTGCFAVGVMKVTRARRIRRAAVLAGAAVLSEDPRTTPCARRRPCPSPFAMPRCMQLLLPLRSWALAKGRGFFHHAGPRRGNEDFATNSRLSGQNSR